MIAKPGEGTFPEWIGVPMFLEIVAHGEEKVTCTFVQNWGKDQYPVRKCDVVL